MLGILAAAMVMNGQPHHKPEHGRHGNPDKLDAYIAKMEDPSRGEWQKPEDVIPALRLSAGDSVCDIGAGPGYFALRLARAVGDQGHVFAVDVEPKILAVLQQRIEASGRRNISPVLALGDDPLLPPKSCDLILIVNTFHHFPDGTKYLRRLISILKRGGRIVNIDFYKKELPLGPPIDHKISREKFLESAALAGLEVLDEPKFLPYQYFVSMRPLVSSRPRTD